MRVQKGIERKDRTNNIKNFTIQKRKGKGRTGKNGKNYIYRVSLREKIKEFTNVLLAVDESTDIVDSAQLVVFIRGLTITLK